MSCFHQVVVSEVLAPLAGAPRGAGYQTVGLLGAGGMATVHLARTTDDLGNSRFVAVKRLHDFIARDPANAELLRDEAWIAGSVRHPNVVDVIDLIDEGGESPALVMEWVDGRDLATITKALATSGRRLPVDVAVAIVRDVLEGLHAAHEATRDGESLELVHRDVSPHNVLVGFDGRARITDFGVAKVAQRGIAVDSDAICGKLGYMAPEQLEARSDRRADVFGVGVILWELLTGKRLRDADGVRVLVQILHDQVTPPSGEMPDARDLDDVVVCALRRDPAERFETARAMAETLVASVAPASPERVAAVLRGLVGEAQVDLTRDDRLAA